MTENKVPAWWEDEMHAIWNASIGSSITADMKRAANIAIKVASGMKYDEASGWHVPKDSVSESIPEKSGQVYGIIDPDYGRLYTIIRTTAWQEGYAIGMHGSFTRDLDLIAVPWAEKHCTPEHLIRRILSRTQLREQHSNPGIKPHGRKTWTLLLPDFGDPRWIDLSIITQHNKSNVLSPEQIKAVWDSFGGMEAFGKSFGYEQFAEEILKAIPK